MTNELNRERLAVLRAAMAKPENPVFMGAYDAKPYEWSPGVLRMGGYTVPRGVCETNNLHLGCGTARCIAGMAVFLNERDCLGIPPGQHYPEESILAGYLGISFQQAYSLARPPCSSNDYAAIPRALMLEVLDGLAETGVVSWRSCPGWAAFKDQIS